MIESGKKKEEMVGQMIAYLEEVRESKHLPKKVPK